MNYKVKQEIENLIKVLNLNCKIEEFKNKVDWNFVSSYQKLSEDFIREFKDFVNWHKISISQKLSEDFIREFKYKVNWYEISICQKLSKDFIRECQHYVNWNYVSFYQKLSEDFIKEFKDFVNWENISYSQKLSENFVREFKDKLNWSRISKYQKLSINFRKEFNIKIDKHNWIYKPVNFKLKKLKEINKYKNIYEIINNKFIIAYKGIRSDNYSCFNFQYKYEVNKTYESHCDCNIDNQDSFGLSSWTLEKAREYCNEKIIKVKININDLGCIVHSGNKLRNKLRCRKFTVLEEVK